MQSLSNRRGYPRVPLHAKLRIILPGVDERRQLLIDNLSKGGLFICTGEPRPVGTRLEFELFVRDGGPQIVGAGVVKWIETNPGKKQGMGIKFLELNEEGKEEILLVLKKMREEA